MKTDAELQRDVERAIQWEPQLHLAEIAVTVDEGIVSLAGYVDSYAKKLEAENAAKRVHGVRALIENIEVQFPTNWAKTDAEIANEVLAALRTAWLVPKDKIGIKIENGWVTLDGELQWNYQREAAKNAVIYLIGIKGVTNNIKVKSDTNSAIEKKDIEDALKRSAIDGSNLLVMVSGSTVTLSGKVNSWYQKEEAERIAWNTPGIWEVNNELSIDYEYAFS
ncbi:BON domain-containing protein [Sphingobacterium siyangense]|uniref:BON domain-containing protein n=1 Tax=Sphingobacterium siyangense TaxID=459529 RepID=UPI003DA66C82